MKRLFHDVVFNSNLSLLRWDFDIPRLALQLSLFIFLVALLLLVAVAFRMALRDPRVRLVSGLAVVLAAAAGALFGADGSWLLAVASAALVGWLFAVVVFAGAARRREVWFAGLVLAALWMSRSRTG